MHTIKPIDRDIIIKALLETRRIVTVEEHNIIAVWAMPLLLIAESSKACAFTKVGILDEYSVIGYPEALYARYKLDATGIAETVRELLGKEIEADEDWTDED